MNNPLFRPATFYPRPATFYPRPATFYPRPATRDNYLHSTSYSFKMSSSLQHLARFRRCVCVNNSTVRANCLSNITCNVCISVVIPAFRRVTSISRRLKFAMSPFVFLYIMWIASLYIFLKKLP